ncbi:MAG: DUF899 domain-containing protein [Candidatus Binataceae bacterium]|jgi:predicted dithiol-disulfide oxidoreductase (DUF899 family)
MEKHQVVSSKDWIEARRELLIKEKEFTRLREQLSQQRRDLPWEAVDKKYVFEGPAGKQTLAELFDGRSQLIVYHFMFDPSWEKGCPHCSFWADSVERNIIHLNHRDVTMVAISHAPFRKLDAYRKAMGWTFKWLSSYDSDFNYDYHVSFKPEEVARGEIHHNYRQRKASMSEVAGISVFFRDSSGEIFHTYSCYERGLDMMNAAYQYLDLVPKGRDEVGQANPQFWVRRHNEYDR